MSKLCETKDPVLKFIKIFKSIFKKSFTNEPLVFSLFLQFPLTNVNTFEKKTSLHVLLTKSKKVRKRQIGKK